MYAENSYGFSIRTTLARDRIGHNLAGLSVSAKCIVQDTAAGIWYIIGIFQITPHIFQISLSSFPFFSNSLQACFRIILLHFDLCNRFAMVVFNSNIAFGGMASARTLHFTCLRNRNPSQIDFISIIGLEFFGSTSKEAIFSSLLAVFFSSSFRGLLMLASNEAIRSSFISFRHFLIQKLHWLLILN
mmetsp:Transcript_18374/g.38558  ORF Transcript_18374/g.38558 Transcript_18374/m.38558 type:complete len:187 (+) Transcript_18374:60-620(+)